ncbi:MAG TPA: thiol:disulfide interchange protein DsbA/DsbL [Rhodanobacteraceae bacterium]
MLKRVATFIVLAAVAGFAMAQAPAQHWVEGTNYFPISGAAPTPRSGKVIVTEVFSYACPYCNQFEPYVDKLRAALPKGAELQFLPASWGNTVEDWPVFQRAYFAAEALHLNTPKSRDALFNAIWTIGAPLNTYDLMINRPKPAPELPTIADVAKFYTQFGSNAKHFVAAAHSAEVDAEMKRADAQIQRWGVTGTPTIVVDGKWRANVPSAKGQQQLVDLTLYLVKKELAARHAK